MQDMKREANAQSKRMINSIEASVKRYGNIQKALKPVVVNRNLPRSNGLNDTTQKFIDESVKGAHAKLTSLQQHSKMFKGDQPMAPNLIDMDEL